MFNNKLKQEMFDLEDRLRLLDRRFTALERRFNASSVDEHSSYYLGEINYTPVLPLLKAQLTAIQEFLKVEFKEVESTPAKTIAVKKK